MSLLFSSNFPRDISNCQCSRMTSLHSMVEECVTIHREHVAVMFDDGHDVVILTYGEMWRRAVLV